MKIISCDNHIVRKALRLSLNEMAVLCDIKQMSQNQKYGYTCIKSKDKIAEWLDLSRSTVFTIIDALVKKGYIEKNEIGIKPTQFIYDLDMCQEQIGLLLRSNDVELVTQKIQDILMGKTDSPEIGQGSPKIGLDSPEIGPEQSRNWTQVYNRELHKDKKEDIYAPFQKPSETEIAEYVLSKHPDCNKTGLQTFVTKFWSHYENNGWKVGKHKMKNWKLAIASWNETIQKLCYPNTNNQPTIPGIKFKQTEIKL